MTTRPIPSSGSSPGRGRAARTASSPPSGRRASAVGIPRPACACGSRATSRRPPASAAARAATVAGLRLYEPVTSPRPPVSNEAWLALATELEGHPDNAAAALLGGLTVSCQYEDGADRRAIVAVAAVGAARRGHAGRRPAHVARRDACCRRTCRCATRSSTCSARCCFVRALETGRYDDLREAMRDRWHQPARAPLGARTGRGAGARRPGGARRLPERRRPLDPRARDGGRRAARPRRCSARFTTARTAMYDQSFVGTQPEQDDHELQPSLPSLPDGLSRRPRSGSATTASARSKSPTTTTPSRRRLSRELIESRPEEPLALSRAAADRRRAAHRPALRLHAARAADRLAARLGVRELYVKDDSVNHPTCSVQGSRGLGRGDARGRARLHGVRVRVDRQPRRQRRGARARGSGSRAPSSSPTTSKPARSPAPASIGRASSRSAATTTT